jgi:hypothetical protein
MRKSLWLRDRRLPHILRKVRLDFQMARNGRRRLALQNSPHRRRCFRLRRTSAQAMRESAEAKLISAKKDAFRRKTAAPGRHPSDPLCRDFDRIAKYDKGLAAFRQKLDEAVAA